MRKLGFDPQFIIDIGAYNGEWTCIARAVFPEASILILAAQENKHPILESLKMASNGKVDYRIAVMGPNDAEKVVFHEYENFPTASSMLQDNAATPSRKVDALQTTLDSILSTNQFPKPDLIKLDVRFRDRSLEGSGYRTLKYRGSYDGSINYRTLPE